MKVSHEIEVDKWCASATSVRRRRRRSVSTWECKQNARDEGGDRDWGVAMRAGGEKALRPAAHWSEWMTNEGVSLVGALFVHTLLRFE